MLDGTTKPDFHPHSRDWKPFSSAPATPGPCDPRGPPTAQCDPHLSQRISQWPRSKPLLHTLAVKSMFALKRDHFLQRWTKQRARTLTLNRRTADRAHMCLPNSAFFRRVSQQVSANRTVHDHFIKRFRLAPNAQVQEFVQSLVDPQ